MKGLVNCYLNVRAGQPSVNADNPAYLKQADEIEVIDKLYGDDVDNTGNRLWYKLSNGTFVWSGGVQIDPPESTNFARSQDVNFWINKLGITTFPLQRGLGLKVAILDSGIYGQHEDFKGVNISWKDFVDDQAEANDYDGHGTHCAGILAGKGNYRIEGVIPFCDLFVVKALYKRGMPSPVSWFADGLKWACENADIISISQSVNETQWNKELEKIIDTAVSKGKLIVCSIGNLSSGGNLQGDFPGKYHNCISVGSLDNGFELSSFTKRFEKLDICLPGEFITSIFNTGTMSYEEDSGTSMSTPLLAGILALKKQKDKKFNLIQARNFIKEISEIKTIEGFNYRAIKNQVIIL